MPADMGCTNKFCNALRRAQDLRVAHARSQLLTADCGLQPLGDCGETVQSSPS